MLNWLYESSKKANIDKIGVIESKSLESIEDYLKYRKTHDMESSFEDADINRRINPQLSFEDVKSIIVVAISYANDYVYNANDLCKLSRSSFGSDYHNVLESRIKELIDIMHKDRSFSCQYSVDKSSLVERELASRAGIGYFGKNTNIINPELGSFIFLGIILTDLEFNKYSKPIEKDCGSCRICIDNCPTKALYDDYKLNPNRCLSYISQSKGDVDLDLLNKMDYVYGCDICQEVCPMNKSVKNSKHQEFNDTVMSISKNELEEMSNREFKAKYGHMAFSWRGKNTILRNCKIIEEKHKK
ncbi:MAG: tRNA epoxyqueuosine(34) reductase QueG [Tissierellia bacterium]|nr:tRNA epoxyqueuosine(34) reductase QueG [Tissierellia bacterium]